MLKFLILAAIAIIAAAVLLPMLRRSRAVESIDAKIWRQVALIREASLRAPGFVMHGNATIARLEEERANQFAFIDKLTADVEKAGRDMVDAERANVEAAHKRVAEIDAQLKPLREFEDLRDTTQQSTSRYTPTGQGAGDGQGDGGQARSLGAPTNEREYKYRSAGEFLADVYRASGVALQRQDSRLSRDMVAASADRLRSHGLVLESGTLVRAAEPHNTTAEVPGLLPTIIVGEIMNNVDAARPFITSVGARDLGGIPGTTFERPTITQHVEVAKQSAEKAEVANRQFTVTGVPFTKDTYGGWANVSRQSIDWTSPGVWDALMTDFIEQYGLETENAAADAFVTAVTQTQELTSAVGVDPTLAELVAGLYGAAVKAYQGSGRLPDTIWASLDWWPKLGVLIDVLKASQGGDGGGDSSLSSFNGNLLQTNRIIVPSFAAGTLIVGVKSRTEVYEDRFGFLSAVSPKVFGVELAYGGYMASGTVKPTAFAKVINAA